jgi:hypothetical protein
MMLNYAVKAIEKEIPIEKESIHKDNPKCALKFN